MSIIVDYSVRFIRLIPNEYTDPSIAMVNDELELEWYKPPLIIYINVDPHNGRLTYAITNKKGWVEFGFETFDGKKISSKILKVLEPFKKITDDS